MRGKSAGEEWREQEAVYEAATTTTAWMAAGGGHQKSRSAQPARTADLQRGLGTRDSATPARDEADRGKAQPADRPSSPSHRRNLARNLGNRDFGTQDFGTSPGFGHGAAGNGSESLDEGRPPPLSILVDDGIMRGRDGKPVLYGTTHGAGGGVGGNPTEVDFGALNGGGGVVEGNEGDNSAPLGSENTVSVAYDDERQRALLNGGGFFIMHGRFGSPQMRFVWMSRDLGFIFWRCCGHTAVKGSAKTTLFDFVHLGLHKSTAASATTTASSTGKALKQIVLTGGAGRNRLVLELDGGNTGDEADLVQTWFEAFNYAVNFANTEVITKMLQPSGRRPTLTQSAATRRASLSANLPAPRTQATSATAADRVGASATSSELSRPMPARTFVANGLAAGGGTGGVDGGSAGRVSPGPTSRPLASLRSVPTSSPSLSSMPADDLNSRSFISDGGHGGADDNGSSAVARTAGSGGGLYGSQASVFVRPPPIVTSSLGGARGPASPPPRGQYTGPSIPSPPRGEVYGGRPDQRDEIEEGKEKKRFIKTLDTEAAAVITAGTLNPTNLPSSTRRFAAAGGETSSKPGGGDGGGGEGGGEGSSGNSSFCNDSESRNKSLSLPFRQLIAQHAPSVADRHPSERPASPQARVGAVRRGSGCDGMPLIGIQRHGSGTGVSRENIRLSVAGYDRPAGRPSSPRARAGAERRGSGCDGVPLTGARRRGSGSGTGAEIAVDGARWARGKDLNIVRRGSQSGGGGGGGDVRRGSGGGGGGGGGGFGGIPWANGKSLTGVLRRGSGDGGETDPVVDYGIRWASSKPSINTRSSSMRPADSYREGPGIPKAIASGGLAVQHQDGSDGTRTISSINPRHNAARQSSYIATGHVSEQGRERTASPTRALARATARRLSALGAKAVGGMGLGGTSTSGNGSGPGATTRPLPPPPPPPPPPIASGSVTGGGSPGARGDSPPPPPSREQRRRMSAAPLTEQQVREVGGLPSGRAAPAIVDAA
eukprot:g5958.t2